MVAYDYLSLFLILELKKERRYCTDTLLLLSILLRHSRTYGHHTPSLLSLLPSTRFKQARPIPSPPKTQSHICCTIPDPSLSRQASAFPLARDNPSTPLVLLVHCETGGDSGQQEALRSKRGRPFTLTDHTLRSTDTLRTHICYYSSILNNTPTIMQPFRHWSFDRHPSILR